MPTDEDPLESLLQRARFESERLAESARLGARARLRGRLREMRRADPFEGWMLPARRVLLAACGVTVLLAATLWMQNVFSAPMPDANVLVLERILLGL